MHRMAAGGKKKKKKIHDQIEYEWTLPPLSQEPASHDKTSDSQIAFQTDFEATTG